MPVGYTGAMRPGPSAANETTVRTLDGVLLFWVVLWLAIGLWTGYHMWQLTGLSASTVDSGRSLRTAADAFGRLGDLPVVGDTVRPLSQRIAGTADGIVTSGQQAERSIRGLSVLIGLAVALGPSAPVLLLYLPARAARRREVREVRAALRSAPGDPRLRAFLAQRAVQHLGTAQLLAITPDPVGDVSGGRHDALARAELARLGVRDTWTDEPTPASTGGSRTPPSAPDRPGASHDTRGTSNDRA